ncbi:methionine--tRNA ligase [Nitrospirillum viridazoti]|uniref:Methionine--tRNA ligase n=1 Tax=Nitrospirillum viridazoti CBAmc TaxID=1441467 RepID=A0A248JVN3_9PROT|nr:methionine--tRNA ligase [Nitrospirillum amazonense]ASG22777.1 methionine--tRNA ligase [Nitrospirillum amazonense CBAmc]TWB33767.1 methionyl-tRNA synthetase [Nitrospirillum amazonense]
MSGRPPFYITTPIYYVNDVPHIGHAYTTIACDVMARFKRLDGYDVKFLTGTDEHGQKVEKSAEKAGIDPQAFTDRVSQNFRDLTGLLNISNDDFIRTTEPRHIKSVQALWQKLVDSGDIYLGSYAGWYSVRDEAYYGEDELRTEADGRKFAPTGAECEWVEEPSYFFRLSAWADRLIAFYEANPDFILPAGKRNEVMSFVKGGLKDLSVSRTTFDWGIPVPGDEKHIMYVWLDALANYTTAIGYPETGEGTPYARYWPALHVVGKDILRFHAVYWPAFLMSAGLQPPRRVFAHGWWTVEGEKMSKSLGNVVAPSELLEKYGLDQTRYFLMREIPFGNDGDFSRRAMVTRINSELANGYGNLAQRFLSIIQKNCGAVVPTPGAFTEADNALLAAARGLLLTMRAELDVQAFHKALDALWVVVGDANRYIDEQAPWALKKTDPARMATVLYVLAEAMRHVAILTQPFMPGSMAKVLDLLAVPADARDFAHLDQALVPGTPLPPPQGVFPRHVEETEGAA